jgi:spoIIIJ-associated protein
MMEPVEAEGNSIDEAIENALRMLGVTRDRAEVEILANATRGLFGLGGRKARVRAALRAPIDADQLLSSAPRPAPASEDEPRTTTVPATDSAATAHAADVLRDILKLMEVEAAVAIRHEDEQDVLELTGDTSGVLIGRRGQMLDALEYFLNRVVARDSGDGRIVVDSQNYRARRRQSLEDLARRSGEQAKKKRRPIALNPMSPRDRRIVHMVLQADPSLSTRSSGKGYFRKLIIIPAGESQAARERSSGPAEER